MNRFICMLALRSAWNRRLTLGMTLLSVALSAALLVGIERLRADARESFAEAVSGTDLIVGARASPVELMLYAVFRIGAATNNIGWQSFQALARDPAVAWAVPLSLGDSHRGFAVLGTTGMYFERFRHGNGRALRFTDGKPFEQLFDAVIGAEVAAAAGYRLGQRITLSHGSGTEGLTEHADKPFVVAGILARTGTAVDRTVHVSLEAIEAIHLDWRGGAPIPGVSIPPEFARKFDLQPKSITAAFIGLYNRAEVFALQRRINTMRDEALMAVMPGVALDELWQIIGTAERSLTAVSALVAVVSLIGLVAVVLAGLNERRRELAILRSIGAGPRDIFMLLTLEGLLITLGGVLLGLGFLTAGSAMFGDAALARYGIDLRPRLLAMDELPVLAVIVGAGFCASLVPGYRAYRMALADGLAPRL